MDFTNENIARNIKSIRTHLGLSMEDFGKKFDPIAHKSLVSKWEKGLTKPSINRLKRISEIANISLNELLYDSPEEYLIDKLGDSIFDNIDGDIDIDGEYFVLSTLVEQYAKQKNIEYFENYSLLNQLDLDDLLKYVKSNINSVVRATIKVLSNITDYVKMQNDDIIRKKLSHELAEALIESKRNNSDIKPSLLLNNGFTLSTLEPYDLHEHVNTFDFTDHLKEFNNHYLKLLEQVDNNVYDPNVLMADAYVIEGIIDRVLEKSNELEEDNHIFLPYLKFLENVKNEQLPKLIIDMNEELWNKLNKE
ncbi:helix-turn-helix domain-containing protein [Mammaliicoccus sciuri]|uniref:helix-turn-helix domain-containing protein n=1 Tax=Mammaliicoccus sciuri TaxID=1296 RepID=UPI00133104B3|nr:helix-turn-helix transcriptional regulator [Mammaliicoccus sciuri]